MKKSLFSLIFVFIILVIGLFVSCASAPYHRNPENELDVYANLYQNLDSRLGVFDRDDKLLFELIGVKDNLIYTSDGEEIEITVFETSTGIDFVKIHAKASRVGISAEYAWTNYTYPDFERSKQNLIFLKINGLSVPFDMIQFINKETDEIKEIYFEISDFFGKW